MFIPESQRSNSSRCGQRALAVELRGAGWRTTVRVRRRLVLPMQP